VRTRCWPDPRPIETQQEHPGKSDAVWEIVVATEILFGIVYLPFTRKPGGAVAAGKGMGM
jgi:hypothetical protein